MKRNEMKIKEPVKLRQRELADGNYSLYLDIYWKGQRKYEFLNLYVKKANNAIDNQQNRQTLLLADEIRARRVIDLQAGKYKLDRRPSDITLMVYFKKLKTDRLNSKGNFGNWNSAYMHLLKFLKGNDPLLVDVDESWLISLKHYLLHDAKIGKGTIKLSQNSALSYFNKVKAALRQAFEEKLISENPAQRVRSIKPAETRREFLTWEEIKKIAQTQCGVRKLKEAFLFSVMTGLRWSDIIKMTWSEVRGSEEEGWYLRFQQQKTKDYEVLPITNQARLLLGEKGDPGDRMFDGLNYSNYTNVALSRWMKISGIDRDITFHCARHTHATLLLNDGVDIYVVSKLLGHKNIKTTEIYTKVAKAKKVEAINKLPLLDIKFPGLR